MAKTQIKLSEENLRNFISYSVSRLLKEGNGFNGFNGRDIIGPHGEYDGSEGSNYGSSNAEISLYEWMDENENVFNNLVNYVNKENGGKFSQLLNGGESPADLFASIVDDDFTLCVDFTNKQGMKGDGYLQPDDPDEFTLDKKVLKQPQANQTLQKISDPLQRAFVQAVVAEWPEWVDEDYVYDNIVSPALYEERNLGITTHFDGSSSFEPENPYENMTWDEYCEAKRREREEEASKPKEEPSRTNRGIMAHFDGKKHEETPEEKERNEHMFDDDYWVNKMNLSKDELSEIVKKTVKRIMEEIGADNEEAQVVDNFPKKASGTFTMRTRRGNVDKYKVYVEKTEGEELLTDIFVYDERGNEWEPQAEYVVGIEEYTNGSWLPYWETFNGDVSIRALANCFDKVVKLWKKVGYLYDEDDEIPFRYSGDYMKGAPKGMF
jgi:hypothetical protein